MSGLEQIDNHLKAIRLDMARLAKIGDSMAEYRALEYIESADLEQCKEIVDALADRVASLLGDASSLEDAAFQLETEIKAQAINNPPICTSCNGSGEGQHDGTRCWACKGAGTVQAA